MAACVEDCTQEGKVFEIQVAGVMGKDQISIITVLNTCEPKIRLTVGHKREKE